MIATNIFGLLIRYSDKLISDIDTIEEHNKIIQKEGSACFGKVGRFIGKQNLENCNNNTIEKWLILVKKENKQYIFHKAPISSAQRTKPNLKLIPNYYRDKGGITCWICLKDIFTKMDRQEIVQWVVKSSQERISKTLSESQSGYFIVTK